jgi:hypothetical protein
LWGQIVQPSRFRPTRGPEFAALKLALLIGLTHFSLPAHSARALIAIVLVLCVFAYWVLKS